MKETDFLVFETSFIRTMMGARIKIWTNRKKPQSPNGERNWKKRVVCAMCKKIRMKSNGSAYSSFFVNSKMQQPPPQFSVSLTSVSMKLTSPSASSGLLVPRQTSLVSPAFKNKKIWNLIRLTFNIGCTNTFNIDIECV